MGKSALSQLRKCKKLKIQCKFEPDQAQNLKRSRPLIAEWHLLEKRLVQAKTEEESSAIKVKMEEFGGLKSYQNASITYQVQSIAKFNSAKWVTSCLKRQDKNICLLDVGALINNFLPYSTWIDCTAIDLNPRHPSVQKYDFFDFKPDSERFDAVVLSLILNYVPCKSKRALMIKQSAELLLDENSLLFIILPKACIANSRYLNEKNFVDGMNLFGLMPVEFHCKSSAKLSFWVFRKCLPSKSTRVSNRVIRLGEKRNNFRIDFSIAL